jgi:hypothetical protein
MSLFKEVLTSKKLFNSSTQELKQLFHEHKNYNIQTFLNGLTPTASTDYSLWKTTKILKAVTQTSTPLRTPQGTCARTNADKVQAFANHLTSVFQPHSPEPDFLPEDTLTSFLETPFQLEPLIQRLKRSEVQAIIKNLPPKKSLGYDLMTGKILKELPTLCIQYLTQLFNAILYCGYFPSQWKVAQIILIPKPGKPPHQLSSYRPTSLLPIASKVFEKLHLKRLLPLVEHDNLIPNHQFGFRPRHSTIDQTHRIIRVLSDALDNSQYCSAAFLDISQAFDKVWHKGLLYKLKRSLPLNHYLILNSYLSNRHFIVKVNTEITGLTPVNAVVPQGSVLGPLLYILHTAEITTSTNSFTATPLQSSPLTVILSLLPKNCKPPSSLFNPGYVIGELKLIRLSQTKSVHMTFTTRRDTCPLGHINDEQITQENHVKYLGRHLDRRLTWHTHTFPKRKQLGLSLPKMYWLLGRKSKLSIKNKLLIYKVILKPIWTYGIQLLGTTSNSNIEILKRLQSSLPTNSGSPSSYQITSP